VRFEKPELDDGVAVYALTVLWNKKEWQVGYDFAQFLTFKQKLEADPSIPGEKFWLGYFPQKTSVRKTDAEFLRKRSAKLQKFLYGVLSNAQVVKLGYVRKFLELEENTN